jgi:hypothetical protein
VAGKRGGMKQLLPRVRCWLGWHSWRPGRRSDAFPDLPDFEMCNACGLTRLRQQKKAA